jgi:hypothetical protein
MGIPTSSSCGAPQKKKEKKRAFFPFLKGGSCCLAIHFSLAAKARSACVARKLGRRGEGFVCVSFGWRPQGKGFVG